jgi:hypothetical protein
VITNPHLEVVWCQESPWVSPGQITHCASALSIAARGASENTDVLRQGYVVTPLGTRPSVPRSANSPSPAGSSDRAQWEPRGVLEEL